MHHLLYLFALLWGRLLIFKGETWPSIRRDGKARCWDTFGCSRFSSDQWTAKGINCSDPTPFSPHTPYPFNHHFNPLRPPPVSHVKSLRCGQQRIHKEKQLFVRVHRMHANNILPIIMHWEEHAWVNERHSLTCPTSLQTGATFSVCRVIF